MKANRNLKNLFCLLVPILSFIIFVGARRINNESLSTREGRNAAFSNMHRFTWVLHQIQENYVDDDKIDYEELIDHALEGMLQRLDPYSQYMDYETYEDMKGDTAGRYSGLGVEIGVRDSILTIISPMEDGPGFRAGLMPKDKIIEIEGESTKGISLPDAVKRLRGDPGTSVTIKVLRPKTSKILDLEIVREFIELSRVKGARIIEKGIGYLRITQFDSRTADFLQTELESLLSQGMTALIMDLRDNPGGLLSSAIEVAQKFLHKDDLIVYTQGRDEQSRQSFKARGRKHYLDFTMIILVNNHSASASEIVAGALQDHKRAILIGEPTYGKGSVQSIIPLDDGSAIRLTTAKYYTPNERVIHENGIKPDIVAEISDEEWARILDARRAFKEDMFGKYQEVEDLQLTRAIDVIKGIKIFQDQAFTPKAMTAR